MKPSVRWLWVGSVAAMTMWSFSAVSLGQAAGPSLSGRILSSTSISPSQRQQIESYVDYWSNQMSLDEDASAVARARRELIAPMSVNHTNAFARAYSPYVARQLAQVLSIDNPLNRINALIVASNLTDATVLTVIRRGLNDANPAVNYWAAKAAGDVAPSLENPDQQQLLGFVEQALQQTDHVQVQQQVLVAMSRITVPGSEAKLAQALLDRISERAQSDVGPLAAERQILTTLGTRLVDAMTGGQQRFSDASVGQIALVMFKYMQLAQQKLSSPDLDPALASEYQQIAVTGSRYLHWLFDRLLSQNQDLAQRVKKPVTLGPETVGDANLLGLAVLEWQAVLQGPMFGIDPSRVQRPGEQD